MNIFSLKLNLQGINIPKNVPIPRAKIEMITTRTANPIASGFSKENFNAAPIVPNRKGLRTVHT